MILKLGYSNDMQNFHKIIADLFRNKNLNPIELNYLLEVGNLTFLLLLSHNLISNYQKILA